MVVWSDGRIIWSQDRLQGGSPYFEAYIEKRSIRSLFDRLEREDLFNRSELNRPYSGPDAEASSFSHSRWNSGTVNDVMA